MFHHLTRFCVDMAVSSARRARRQPVVIGPPPAIIVQHNQTNTGPPGTGYLPGYQPFTNQPSNTVVINPQPAVNVVPVDNIKPDSYMVVAILATLFCFFPFGIVGIVYASQVDSAFESGDYVRARSSSSAARGWTIASCIAGSVVICFVFLYVFLGVINTSNYDDY